MSAPPFKVKAIFDYTSPHDDDLKFSNGQIITVTQEEDEDWYHGEYVHPSGLREEGIFPRNFVERYEPETPPRPSRAARPKNEAETTPAVTPQPSTEPRLERPDRAEPTGKEDHSSTEPQSAALDNKTPEPPPSHTRLPGEAHSTSLSERSQKGSSTRVQAKPAPQAASKGVPPAVAEKPAGSSFRDRIAAFNKPTAAPLAPPKPGGPMPPGTSSFVKKPFIAPPPSRDAYIPPTREQPPQRVYRREEDPDIAGRTSHDVESSGRSMPPAPAMEAEDGGDQAKPTSLKDRIALLQKQQMEQAARHAEAAQRKEKPKRPPKKRMESQEVVEPAHMGEGDTEGVDSEESMPKRSSEINRSEGLPSTRSSTKRYQHREADPTSESTGMPKELLSDANDADQSGAGDTEDAGDFSTERDDSDEKPKTKASETPRNLTRAPTTELAVKDRENGSDEEREDEDDEVDPEVKRRLEIRERMAKMSGGMGMAGMFGPPGAMPMPGVGGTKSQKGSGSSERKIAGHSGGHAVDSSSAAARAPPVPIMPMLGMQKVRSPEQVDRQLEIEREDTTSSRSITQTQAADDVSDVEDLKSEPLLSQALDRDTPRSPTVPQGLSSWALAVSCEQESDHTLDRPVPPPPPFQQRGPPPPVPGDRLVSPPSSQRQ